MTLDKVKKKETSFNKEKNNKKLNGVIFKFRYMWIKYYIKFILLVIDKSWNSDFMNKEYFLSKCKFLYSQN